MGLLKFRFEVVRSIKVIKFLTFKTSAQTVTGVKYHRDYGLQDLKQGTPKMVVSRSITYYIVRNITY